jgi:DNA adenine methylase
MKSYSPLRYPGGKVSFYPLVRNILETNHRIYGTYIEPFAGGCGLSLKLLFSNDVSRIVINDNDPAIYSFWYSILNHTDDFIQKIQNTEITIDEWKRQRRIYFSGTGDVIELGFSAFFLNRTNRSGIIKAGVIGGVNQNGHYKLDVRYNKARLIALIQQIASLRTRIHVSNFDAKEMLTNGYLKQFRNTFINFDPPYVIKGAQLYQNSFSENDHRLLCSAIKKCKRPWIITYDVCDLIEDLYQKYRSNIIPVGYSAGKTKQAFEYIIYSNDLIIPESAN